MFQPASRHVSWVAERHRWHLAPNAEVHRRSSPHVTPIARRLSPQVWLFYSPGIQNPQRFEFCFAIATSRERCIYIFIYIYVHVYIIYIYISYIYVCVYDHPTRFSHGCNIYCTTCMRWLALSMCAWLIWFARTTCSVQHVEIVNHIPAHTCLPAPSKGCQLNPQGCWIDTL